MCLKGTLCTTLHYLGTTEIPIAKAAVVPVGKLMKRLCLDEDRAAQLLFHSHSSPLAKSILLPQLCKS